MGERYMDLLYRASQSLQPNKGRHRRAPRRNALVCHVPRTVAGLGSARRGQRRSLPGGQLTEDCHGGAAHGSVAGRWAHRVPRQPIGPRSEPVRPEDRARRHRASLYVRSVHDQSHDLIAICASPTMAMPSTPADIMTGPLGTAVMTRTRRGSPWTCASAAVPQSAPATSW